MFFSLAYQIAWQKDMMVKLGHMIGVVTDATLGTNKNKVIPYHSFGSHLLFCYSPSIYLAHIVQFVSSSNQTLMCLLLFVVPILLGGKRRHEKCAVSGNT